jgi:hypothetical protein
MVLDLRIRRAREEPGRRLGDSGRMRIAGAPAVFRPGMPDQSSQGRGAAAAWLDRPNVAVPAGMPGRRARGLFLRFLSLFFQ